jgi:hypothetical protein
VQVSKIKAELLIYHEETNWDQPVRIQIDFDNGLSVRLRSTDGEILVIDQLPLEEPCDMDEYGSTNIFEISNHIGFPFATNRGPVMHIRSSFGDLVGLAFTLDGGEFFAIWVGGDEFWWGNKSDLESFDWGPDWAPKIAEPFEGFN